MDKEKKLNGTISSYGYDGEGVCRVDGKVCFVPFTLKDESVDFVVKQEKSSFCKGKVKTLNSQSEERIEAKCPYFEKCGGCTYQHSNYENEINIKKELLSFQLKKLEFFDDIKVVKSDKEFGYRNKIRLFVENDKVGFKYRESNKIIDIEKCYIANDLINNAISQIRLFLSSQKIYDNFSEIIIKSVENECLINFVKKNNKKIEYQGLLLLLGRNYGIFETFNKKTTHVLGKKFIEYKEFDLNCKASSNSFRQINDYIETKLYEEVLLNLKGKKILNCYSGAGVLTGIIAKKKIFTTGVELGESEHQDAENLKNENNLIYMNNILGDCSKVLLNLDKDYETIIVDPPRAGLDEKVVEAINQYNSKILIYISCNSATLIRDLTRLKNYKLKKVELFDMFPRTGEYEVFTVLENISD